MSRSKDDFTDHVNRGGFDDAPRPLRISIEDAINTLTKAGYTIIPPAVSDDTN